MAFLSAAVSVGTSATEIYTFVNETESLYLYNAGSTTVFLGGPGVTTAAGTPLAASTGLAVDALPGEVVYGIVASGTESVRVLQQGV